MHVRCLILPDGSVRRAGAVRPIDCALTKHSGGAAVKIRLDFAWQCQKSEETILQRKMTKGPRMQRDPVIFLAPRPGLEPGTCGLTVRRSTN